MADVDDPGDGPTRPKGYDPSLGWAMEADMASQMDSATKHAKAIAEARLEQQLPTEPDVQQAAPDTSNGEPAQVGDPLDGKLGWAMEYIDSSRNEDQSLQQAPTSAPSQERPSEQYDELKALAWALAADEVTQPSHTPDLEPTME